MYLFYFKIFLGCGFGGHLLRSRVLRRCTPSHRDVRLFYANVQYNSFASGKHQQDTPKRQKQKAEKFKQASEQNAGKWTVIGKNAL